MIKSFFKNIYFIYEIFLLAVVSTTIALIYQTSFEKKAEYILFFTSKGMQVEGFLFLTLCTGMIFYLLIYKNNFFSKVQNILCIFAYFMMALFLQVGIYTNTTIVFFFLFIPIFIYFFIVIILECRKVENNIDFIVGTLKNKEKLTIIFAVILYTAIILFNIISIIINSDFLNKSFEASYYGLHEPNVYKRLVFFNVIDLVFNVILFLNLIVDVKILKFENILESNIVSFVYIVGLLNELLLPYYLEDKILNIPYFILPIIFMIIYLGVEGFYIYKLIKIKKVAI